jgi:hypothetical protein
VNEAKAAIDGTKNAMLVGRKLKIDYAKPKQPGGSNTRNVPAITSAALEFEFEEGSAQKTEGMQNADFSFNKDSSYLSCFGLSGFSASETFHSLYSTVGKSNNSPFYVVSGQLNSIPIDFLIDNGSTHCLMHVDLWKNCGSPELNPIEVSILNSSSDNLQVLGFCLVNLQFGPLALKWPFIVTKSLPVIALIGHHFLVKNEMIINYRSDTLVITKANDFLPLKSPKSIAFQRCLLSASNTL